MLFRSEYERFDLMKNHKGMEPWIGIMLLESRDDLRLTLIARRFGQFESGCSRGIPVIVDHETDGVPVGLRQELVELPVVVLPRAASPGNPPLVSARCAR